MYTQRTSYHPYLLANPDLSMPSSARARKLLRPVVARFLKCKPRELDNNTLIYYLNNDNDVRDFLVRNRRTALLLVVATYSTHDLTSQGIRVLRA